MNKKKLILTLSVVLAIVIALTVTLCVLFVPRDKKLSGLISAKGIVKIECRDRRYEESGVEALTYELDESKWDDFIEKTRNTTYKKINDVIKCQCKYDYTIYYEDGVSIFFDEFYCSKIENGKIVKATNFYSSVAEDKYFELFIS